MECLALSVVFWTAGCGTRPAEPTPLANMVRIPAGSFVRMNQKVTLTRDFWIGKYEVTQAEYSEVAGKNPSHFKDDPKRPVEKVTFFEASDFCVALTERERRAGRLPLGFQYRLPTEAEWEYACRAGTTNFYSWGDDASVAAEYAWTSENSDGATHPVGQKRPNPWGLHDIHGNVWEWCSDWFAPYAGVAVTNPAGPPTGKAKVFRGGGWNNEVPLARSSNRFMMAPTNGIHFVGFRLVLASSPP